MIDHDAIREMLTYLVGGKDGRRIDDPVVQAVTERLIPQDRVSTCTYLCHAFRYIMGLRNRVNRREAGNFRNGTPTMAYLCEQGVAGPSLGHPCASVPSPTSKLPFAASILLDVGHPKRTHACVVLEHGDGYIITADYGQHPFENQRPEHIACKVRRRSTTVRAGRIWADDRPIDSVLPLEAELAWAARQGTLRPALDLSGWLERNGARSANVDEGKAAADPKGAA